MIAEKALLGTFLTESGLIQDSSIKAEHFETAHHRALMNLMKRLVLEGQEVDPITISFYDDPAKFGGVSYLNELVSYSNPLKVDEYENLVIEGWKEREKRNILTVATTENWDINKVISSLDAINEVKADDHISISDSLSEIYESPWQEQTNKRGVPTGLRDLDRVTYGWQDGDLIIIGARPSMGKTDVMLHLAKQAGWHDYLPVIFSLEMQQALLRDRLIASTGGYNRTKMRNPYKSLTQEQKDTWTETLGKLSLTNIQIFDKAGQSIPEMRAKTKKVMNQFPEKKPIIFIDYLGLIKPNEFYGGSANAQITEISRNLKGMAKDFNCPVICLSQLNRSVEQRENKRPQMSDIRDSGSVEQDADIIIFIYRDKYYTKDPNDKTLELIVAKNRNGQIGTIYTDYNEFTGVIKDADS